MEVADEVASTDKVANAYNVAIMEGIRKNILTVNYLFKFLTTKIYSPKNRFVDEYKTFRQQLSTPG